MSLRVFVVVGAKGGVGASSIAMQLVEQLPSSGPRYIVDADLAGRRSLAISYDVAKELDLGRVPGSPATVAKGRLNIVELARSYEDGFIISPEAVEEYAAELPENGLVVVDAPQPFAATVRPFIMNAAKVVVISEPTLLGVGSAHAMLSALDRFGVTAARIAFTLYDLRNSSELRAREIQESLKFSVAAELPPYRDRTWQRLFGRFAESLAATPELDPIVTLRPSASNPIGDRRQARRLDPVRAEAANFPGASASGGKAAIFAMRGAGANVSAEERLKTELHAAMLTKIDFLAAARAHTDAQKLADLRQQVDAIADEFLASRKDITSAEHASRIRHEVIEEALGLGPLESLLHEPDITEIMVNGYANIFVERRGRIERTDKQFVDDRQVRLVIERIIAPLGRRLDEASPMVDARLPDGSRVNAIVAPLAIDGPTLTIRRFGTKRFGVDDLIKSNSITPPVMDFLRAAVEARLNIVVSGGTGSGKTTLLNALSSFIPKADRIVTIEDAAELKLEQPHVVRLESRPPNLEGKGHIAIRDLVRNSLRMRPDRIVVGECRGGEALDMLQAMNTGHDGSLTTVHANTARDALSRIETMVLMAGFDLPVRAIREQVAGAVDLVVQVSRLRDGSRRVIGVSEVVGMEGDVVTMQELVRYNQRGVDAQGKVLGEFEPCGVQPVCLGRFEELGVAYDPITFQVAPIRRAEAAWLR
ncbi:MAG: type secretion system protein [Candidatus Eremiobacteraeota bacterium]|jgi:pilus assembly protein CpaF|nr:type secretion system protein [Candidatus Eremiobacteraeota bacterium]